MKNRLVIIGSIIVLCSITIFIFFREKKKVTRERLLRTVGIIQTTSHPALDAACQGFLDTIKQEAGDTVTCVIRNGEGSINNLHTIAHQFHAKADINAIFAIATPAVQAISSVEKEKPISIAAVSVAPMTSPIFAEKNICGTSDMINVRSEVEAMKALLPNAKNIGIMHSTGEVNSIAMSQIMVEELQRIDLVPTVIGITFETDIEPALVAALRKIDVLLVPTDNMVASAIDLIVTIMRKVGKPLIVSDNLLVKAGALMGRGVNYYESGQQAASILLDVLVNHKEPSSMPIISANTREIYINKQVCQDLGIMVPALIEKDVVFV